jgi:FtsH-binding integral membrane protein
MTIKRNSWHARIYAWWYTNKYNHINPDYINLCPYMRAVLFWAPLRMVFWDWIKIWKIPINCLTIPVILYLLPVLSGYESYTLKQVVLFFYALVVGIALGGTIIIGIIYLGEEYGKPQVVLVASKMRETSFIQMIGEWFRSFHDGICPTIHIE